jgi:iron complex transport system substrate-binding protein
VNTSSGVRRSALLLVPVLAIAALAGCAASSDDAASSGDAVWSYTDDVGTTVNLDHEPERVASFTDYATGLFGAGIEPVAVFGRTDVATDERFADYDLSGTAIVGNSYGEIDLEALAEAAPDVIIVGASPGDREGTIDQPYYGFADQEQQDQIERIAPILTITVGGNGADIIASENKLAEALGGDADLIAAAKAEYDAAAADLTAAAAESDLEVTHLYADADGLYLYKPQDNPEDALYSSLGVTFTDLDPEGDYFWDTYSWENAAETSSGDVLLIDNEGYQLADLEGQPTFASSPAIAAGQTHSWIVSSFDYTSQAAHMTELAAILRGSQKL